MTRILFILVALSFLGCGDDDTGDADGDADADADSDADADADADADTDADADADADGDADGDSDGDADVDDVTCEDACDFAIECEPEDDHQACLDYCACQVPLLRPEFDREVWACLTLSCDTSEDGCFTSTAEGLGDSAASAAYAEACSTKVAECGGSLSDDYCFATPLADDVVADLEACLDMDCEPAADCIIDVIGTCR